LQIPFDAHAADVDETPLAGETPAALVLRLSRAKATVFSIETARRAVSQDVRVARRYATLSAAGAVLDAIILAADTTVALDGEVVGKPRDAVEAQDILKRLRGRMHQVFTGLTLAPLISGGERPAGDWSTVCETRVHMRNYGDDELLAYIDAGEVYDKAGAYAIQDAVFHPVARIEGCYMNVMGLPLCEVIRGLRAVGVETHKTEPARHDCLTKNGRPCGNKG
jgi:MAF protein